MSSVGIRVSIEIVIVIVIVGTAIGLVVGANASPPQGGEDVKLPGACASAV